MGTLKGRYTKKISRNTGMVRKAFLDDLATEALETPYEFSSVEEAVNYLTSKYDLSYDEIKYLKKEAKNRQVGFVGKSINQEN